jgi:phosphoribosylanthranilate isomerase
MSVKIKICGLSTRETVETAVAAGAEFIGFVFFAKSPRNVNLEQAKSLAELARGLARIVALTVDADDALLQQIAEQVQPDFIQAHGSESPERIAQISKLTGKPVIKAIKVGTIADVLAGEAYKGHAAFVLFDAKAPETLKDALPGGNGLPFDWSLLSESDGGFMLSGGLNPANVAEALRVTRAPMVDVSSGVESAPGIKDPELIRKFIEAAKADR